MPSLRASFAILACSWLACAQPAPVPQPSAASELQTRLDAALATDAARAASRAAHPERQAVRALRFEPNRGQIADAAVRFAARGEREDLLVTAAGFAIAPHATQHGAARPLQVALAGANAAPRIEPLDPASGVSHYYRGDDPSAWQTGVPGYARVALRGVRPGVDWVLHGSGSAIEYDFEIAPGADPAAIVLSFEGADALELDASGNLHVSLGGGVRADQHRPVAYQESVAGRVPVDARWVIDGDHRARFAVADYDRSRPLVIDPVVLVWSTYLGGSDFNSDGANAVAVGADGRVYVVGHTGSADFPTANAEQPLRRGLADAFVTVFEPDGQHLVYSTFLGGDDTEDATGVAVDAHGRAFVTGQTYSRTFPTLGASQPTFGGNTDVFVTALNADGTLLRSTFLGGSGEERGGAIALDALGRATVGGSTASRNFPTTPGAFDRSCGTDGLCNPTFGFPQLDLFVARFGVNGDLGYATYLGGERDEFFGGLAVEADGSAHVAGYTISGQFPTRNALYPSRNGIWEDAVVAKLGSDGASLAYSTYLGGDQTEVVGALAVDADGNTYVTGFTLSDDFPLLNPLQSERRGHDDAFVTKIAADGASLLYSTLLGGNDTGANGDSPNAIAVDAAGRAYIAGETTSDDFPLLQPRLGRASPTDSFVSVLDASGSSLVASSYVGGSGIDIAYGLALDAAGDVHLAGITEAGYPTEKPFQPQHGGGQYDAYVARLSLAPADLACSVATGAAQYGNGEPVVATSLRVENQTGFAVAARIAMTLIPPNGVAIPLAPAAGVLAAGFDHDIGPVAITTVGPATPRGDYTLRCEVADPATGTPYATGEAAFAVR